MGRGHVDELSYVSIANQRGFAFQQGELSDIFPQQKIITLALIENAQGETAVAERQVGYGVLVLVQSGRFDRRAKSDDS